MNRQMPKVRLGELVARVPTWNPNRDGGRETLHYIDLGSVDNETKLVTGYQTVIAAEAPSRARQLVRSGDILVSTVRPNLNGVAQVPDALDGATASTGFCVLRASKKIDAKYIFHWVRAPDFVSSMTRMATGQSYPAVSDRIIFESEIPLPPLDEQRRIAAILDQSDALRRKRRETLSKLEVLAEAIFSDLFSDPIRNEAQHSVLPLIELIDRERPITYGILKPGPDVVEGTPYVRVVDIKDGRVLVSQVRRTSSEIARQYRRSTLKTGDLLISIRGHVGRMAITPEILNGANITQDTARLAIARANPIFVNRLLCHSSSRKWMVERTRGIAVQGINLGDLKRFPVIQPPREQQDQFAAKMARLVQLREMGERQLVQLDDLFMSLQHRAFNGRLTTKVAERELAEVG